MAINIVWVVTIFGKEEGVAVGGFWIDGILSPPNIVRSVVDAEDVVCEHSIVLEQHVVRIVVAR